MAQHDYVIANGTGAAVRSDLNAGFAAIVSQNSGATAPSTTYAYQSWADTSAGVMKMRNGANNAWITLYQLDGEWTSIAFENGTAAAPSIYFKDSGTDTGIYSPGADQVGISTGGTVRLTTTTTGITSALPVDVPLGAVGTPSITFTGDLNTGIYSPGADQVAISTGGVQRINIEADGDINIDGGGVFYDATNNRLGINTASPGAALDVATGIRVNSGGTVTSGFGNGINIGTWDVLGYDGNDVVLGGYRTSQYTGLRFYNGGSEKARIDSSGRLLVGTSSASSAGAYAQYGLIKTQGNSAASGGVAIVNIARGEGAATITSGEDLGAISFTDSAGNEFGTIICAADADAGASDYPGRLVFSTTADGAASPTERMRISSDGFTNVFVSANDGFQSRNSAAAGTSVAVFGGRHSATGTTNGTLGFVVWSNGNVVNTNNSYGALSDIKLKENIVDAGSQWADIKAFRVRKYNLKEGQKHTQIGGIAQEVELVSPGLVTESPDRDEEGNDLGTVTKSINYSVLYMKAVKALQEAMDRIETLEARLTAAGIE